MKPGSRILITGGAGSCGRYVTAWLLARGRKSEGSGDLGLLEGHDGKRDKESVTTTTNGDLECGISAG